MSRLLKKQMIKHRQILALLSCLTILVFLGSVCIGGDTAEKRETVQAEATKFDQFMSSLNAFAPDILPPPWIVDPISNTIVNGPNLNISGYAPLGWDRPHLFSQYDEARVTVYISHEETENYASYRKAGDAVVNYLHGWEIENVPLYKGKNIIAAKVTIRDHTSAFSTVSVESGTGLDPPKKPQPTIKGYPYIYSLHREPVKEAVDAWRFYQGECVSYVAWALSVNGQQTDWLKNRTGTGHAFNWPNIAEANNIETGSKPRVGAVVVWNQKQMPGYGHVAYVYAVSDDGSYSIAEMNYDNKSSFRTQTLKKSNLEFIYP